MHWSWHTNDENEFLQKYEFYIGTLYTLIINQFSVLQDRHNRYYTLQDSK